MAIGNWIERVKSVFKDGPMKEMADAASNGKVAAEDVEITDDFRQTFSGRTKLSEEQRNSFLFSMLVMASYVVIADGKAEPTEYQYIGRFLGKNFGPDVEQESMEVLQKLVAKHEELAVRKPNAFLQLIGDCGQQMEQLLGDDLRYQLLSMLVMISKSDNALDDKEIDALKDVAVYMGMKCGDVDSLLNLDPELAKEGWPDLDLFI